MRGVDGVAGVAVPFLEGSSSISRRMQVTWDTHSVPHTCIDVTPSSSGAREPVRRARACAGWARRRRAPGGTPRDPGAPCVDHDAVLAPLQPAFAQPRLGDLGRLGEEVRLEEHPVEGDPEPPECLALAGDHPRACLEPQLQRLALPGEHPFEQLVGRVVAQPQLTRQRVLGGPSRAPPSEPPAAT